MKKATMRVILSKAIAMISTGADVYTEVQTHYTKDGVMSFDDMSRIIHGVRYRGHTYTVQISRHRATRDGHIDRLGQKESFEFPNLDRRNWNGDKLITVWY